MKTEGKVVQSIQFLHLSMTTLTELRRGRDCLETLFYVQYSTFSLGSRASWTPLSSHLGLFNHIERDHMKRQWNQTVTALGWNEGQEEGFTRLSRSVVSRGSFNSNDVLERRPVCENVAISRKKIWRNVSVRQSDTHECAPRSVSAFAVCHRLNGYRIMPNFK